MVRHTIAVEGVPKPDGRVMQEGALYWNKDVFPIVGTSSEFPIGEATDIRREADGKITAELSIDLEKDCQAFVFMDQVCFENEPDRLVVTDLVITNGRLLAVFIGPNEDLYPAVPAN